MTKNIQFEKKNKKFLCLMKKDIYLQELTRKWFYQSSKYEYSYHFTWLGLPIIQFPQDIIALQELIWKIKPDLIIETGIAHGGSLIFSASLLELLGEGEVLGIDIDIRKHNKKAIQEHPLYKRIKMLEGSSINKTIIKKVYKIAKGKKRILVILDSNHTQEHVFQELNAYSSLIKKGSYIVVLDTIIEDMPKDFVKNRQWSKGNNPKTAIHKFLKTNDRFKIDHNIHNKLLITVAPSGYLKCVN